MVPLSAAALRRHAVPRWAWTGIGSTVGGALVLAEFIGLHPPDPMVFDRFELGSPAYLCVGLQIAAMALPALVWVAPLTATVAAGVVYPLIPFGQASFGWAWTAAAVLIWVALLFHVLARWFDEARDRARVAVPSRFAPDGYRQDDSPAAVSAWPGWTALALGAAVAVGLLTWHGVAAATAAEFEARAEQRMATVASLNDGELVVAADSGEQVRIGEPWFELAEGQRVLVLVNPLGAHPAVLAAAPDDPSWAIGASVAAVVAGVGGFARFVLRGRRRDDLVSAGGFARQARWMEEDGRHYLLPANGMSPRRRVLDLDPLTLSQEQRQAFADLEDSDAARDRDFVAGPDPGDGPDEDDEPPRGADLGIWADRVVQEEPSEQALDPVEEVFDALAYGPALAEVEAVTVHGGLAEGCPVAVRRPNGEVWIGELRVDLPWRRHTRTPGEVTGGPVGQMLAPALSHVEPWVVGNIRWLRWAVPLVSAVVLGVASGLGVALLNAPDWGWQALFHSAVLLGWTGYLVVLAADFMAPEGAAFPHRSGVLLPGLLVDQVMAPRQVEQVVPGEVMIGVRLRSDALSLDPEGIEEGASPFRAASLLSQWLARAEPDARGGGRPGPAAFGIAVLVVCAALAVGWAVQTGWSLG